MLFMKFWNHFNRDNHERLVHIEDKVDGVENVTNSMSADTHERLVHIEGKIDEMMHNRYFTRSYAMEGEDVVIYRLFKLMGIDNPTYIDIGAHHPYEISNTALMHEKGCHGINIEANPNLFEAFLKERPNDINICCGVGKEEGEMPFYMIDDWSGINSFIKERVDKFVNENPEFKIREVRQIKIDTLTNILNRKEVSNLYGGGGYHLTI